MYSDASGPMQPPDDTRGEEGQPNEDSGETALIPKSLCPGMKPGDTLTMRIVSEQEDEYEVAYEQEEEQGEEAPAPPEAAAPPAPGGGAGDMYA